MQRLTYYIEIIENNSRENRFIFNNNNNFINRNDYEYPPLMNVRIIIKYQNSSYYTFKSLFKTISKIVNIQFLQNSIISNNNSNFEKNATSIINIKDIYILKMSHIILEFFKNEISNFTFLSQLSKDIP